VKVVLFNGSPRIGGNIDLLMDRAVTTMDVAGQDIVRFNLNLMNIKPCQDCGGCEKTGRCVIKDDMGLIYDAIREGERFLLASPIFFFGLSAQAKAMVDRCQALWCEKYLLKKPVPEGPNGRKGLLLVVGGMKKELGIQCSEATAKAFFRTINVNEHETAGFLSIDEKGAVLDHEEVIEATLKAVARLIDPGWVQG
jgi:NAD(P)H-dependent FMN reductase